MTIKRFIKEVLGVDDMDFAVEHQLPSYILSSVDEPCKPSDALIKLCLSAVENTMSICINDIIERVSDLKMKEYMKCWPGEHYRLLAGFVSVLKPKLIVEIGTATGASAACMKKYLPRDGKIITFDVVKWNEYPATLLNESDFDAKLEQRVYDLSGNNIDKDILRDIGNATLLFIDAAKDGVMEWKFVNMLNSIRFKGKTIVIFDDIRMMDMIAVWRAIRHPKLDLTSFGHWSGTGVVQWS